MTSLFEAQLDYIFFFYGLAFVLLGGLCLVIAGRNPDSTTVRLIGWFGCVHGAGEWLDMVALVVGDSAEFAVFRAAVMTISFVLLAESARQGGRLLGVALPGVWIYLPLAILIAAVGVAAGLTEAKVTARYLLGAPGALGVALVIWLRRGEYIESSRPLMIAVALILVVYAIAIGVFVEPAGIWPADVLNEDTFRSVIGVPIQLVRGVIAVVLATLIWAAWGRRLMQTIDSLRYTAHRRREFVGLLLTMLGILSFGWVLTNVLGDIHRQEVEAEAAGDVALLVSAVSRETAIADAMVKALAGAPSVRPLLTGGNAAALAAGQAVLDLDVDAVGATRGLIVDHTGAVVAISDRHHGAWLGTPNRQANPWFAQAIEGRPVRELQLDPVTAERTYRTCYPIRGGDGETEGVAVLETSLESMAAGLRRFDQAFFIVDRRGVVLITNRPDELQRRLWPGPELAPMQLAEQLGASKRPPLLAREVFGGQWTEFEGRRSYVLRQTIDGGQTSLVLAIPITGIFASRLLGIIITLLCAVGALFYFFGRDRGARERVEQMRREELQNQTRDLARQAATDALTGLANRLKFNQRLDEELSRAKRTGRPFSLIMYDIDHFKEINDVYGHPAGDQVLVRLSQTVAASIRQIDLLARWGGEEFVVLLAETDAVSAYQTAEKLRQLVAHTIFDQVGTVTSSFGVAQASTEDDADSLMARVDNALYRAKLNGRNRVELSVAVIQSAELSPIL